MYVGSSDASSKSALNLVQIVHPTLRTTCSLGAPPLIQKQENLLSLSCYFNVEF